MRVSSHGSNVQQSLNFITDCIKAELLSPPATTAARRCPPDLNWNEVVELATDNGVLPLFCKAVNRSPPASYPVDIQQQLELSTKAAAIRNLFFAKQLARIQGHLGLTGVRALAIKGPAIASMAYGNIALRNFSDLDLLVSEESYACARDELLRLGYHQTQDYGWQSSYRSEQSHVTVDLHCRLLPEWFPLTMGFEELAQRAINITVDSIQIKTLSLEDSFFLLCGHIAKDFVKDRLALVKLTDLAWLISHRGDLDWDVISRRAETQHLHNLIAGCVQIAATVLRLTLPANCPSFIAEHRMPANIVSIALSQLQSRMRFPAEGIRAFIVCVRYKSFFWKGSNNRTKICQKSMRISLRHMYERYLLPNEKDHEVVTLSRRFEPLYFAVRPIRLAYEGIRHMIELNAQKRKVRKIGKR